MELKPGSRWKSAVCDTEVALVKPAPGAHTLECGGHEMVSIKADKPAGLTISPNLASGTLLGKRYVETTSAIEVLCTKAGAGTLSIDGNPMEIKDAKALPSSD